MTDLTYLPKISHQMSSQPHVRSKRPPKPKPENPILTSIKTWHSSLPPELLSTLAFSLEQLLIDAPKRWVVYPPMILLPSGSFVANSWKEVLETEPWKASRDKLWKEMLKHIGRREGKGELTHLAINSGIPLHQSQSHDIEARENILRTPSGLVTLVGDFGPALSPEQKPSKDDFEKAFWVNTKQNGIMQVWAPRYTMFSRGNVKEKARLLGFHSSGEIQTRERGTERLRRDVAVDLYAGIGYFVFSYVGMGIGNVFGWEINPWSVEGLRRGARLNGWDVCVVEEGEEWETSKREVRIVVFLESNERALERLSSWNGGEVRHVNCGLLPSSEGSWEMALKTLRGEGWVHLHENVGVKDVEDKKVKIEEIFRAWLAEWKDERSVKVEHIEYVKTFAPGIWHCVFDVYVAR